MSYYAMPSIYGSWDFFSRRIERRPKQIVLIHFLERRPKQIVLIHFLEY